MTKLFVVIFFWGLAAAELMAETPPPALIPAPLKMELSGGEFQLTRSTLIYADAASRSVAEYLAGRLRPATAFPLPVKRARGTARPDGIWLTTSGADTNLGAEGYALTVTPKSVVIRAPTAAGLFYGAQTLRQLLPAEIFSTNRVDGVAWKLPGVQIEDRPRFVWRGFMLDVSRHFFTKAEVEQLLDAMALLKLNTFHWHLVDDQGWRVPGEQTSASVSIRRHPRPTGRMVVTAVFTRRRTFAKWSPMHRRDSSPSSPKLRCRGTPPPRWRYSRS